MAHRHHHLPRRLVVSVGTEDADRYSPAEVQVAADHFSGSAVQLRPPVQAGDHNLFPWRRSPVRHAFTIRTTAAALLLFNDAHCPRIQLFREMLAPLRIPVVGILHTTKRHRDAPAADTPAAPMLAGAMAG